MEYQEDKEKDTSSSSERTHTKRKAPSDIPEKIKEQEEHTENMETKMEINRGEDLGIEEEVLRKLLNEWRNLDEQFNPKDQRRLYAETFQQYQAKQGKGKIVTEEHQESQKDS